MAFRIDPATCIECGICREVCPPHAIRHRRDRTIHQYEIVEERCTECEDAPCLALCPIEDAIVTTLAPERVRELRTFPPERPEWPGLSAVRACGEAGEAAERLIDGDALLEAAARGELGERQVLALVDGLWEIKRWSYAIYGTWVNVTVPRRYTELEYWTSRILFDEWRELSSYTELLIRHRLANHKRALIRNKYAKLPEFLGAAGRFIDWLEINSHFDPAIRFASLGGSRCVELIWKERLGRALPPELGRAFQVQIPALRGHCYMAMIAIGRYHDGTPVMAKEIDWAFRQGMEFCAKALTEIGQRGLEERFRIGESEKRVSGEEA